MASQQTAGPLRPDPAKEPTRNQQDKDEESGPRMDPEVLLMSRLVRLIDNSDIGAMARARVITWLGARYNEYQPPATEPPGGGMLPY